MPIREAAKDITFGGVAGIVAAVFEYPFDLAKVRLQAQLLSQTNTSQLRFNGPCDCLVKTWRGEGIRGLYRGLTAPIAGAMVESSVLFTSYSYFQNLIHSLSATRSGTTLSLPQLAVAAGGAGSVTSFVITPVELVKCRMQVQMLNMPIHMDPPSARNYSMAAVHVSNLILPARVVAAPPVGTIVTATSRQRPMGSSSHSPIASFTRNQLAGSTWKPPGILSVTASIIRVRGLRGLWLGHTGTMLRDTGGSAVWFSVKEWAAARLQDRRRRQSMRSTMHKSRNESLLPWESALAGALAGAVSTLLLYPADTVKSAVQTEEVLQARPRSGTKSPRFLLSTLPDPKAEIKSGRLLCQTSSSANTFLAVLRRMYASHGLRGLYTGCGMTVARTVPASGIIFVVYDGLSAWFA
ncbi:hypothetical protein AMATHDRAFT_155552 [Amanita thiersii Skay4041]|uniref:Mitochondrial carrier n=1 Tax=Amanita thiersii Skay4041 TaxID=703135 RepID=A0A2A9NF07_9AGAR|nr:hypothetical protein AMATHDRAFT_155552 [Amanita thiersii Skay4041]